MLNNDVQYVSNYFQYLYNVIKNYMLIYQTLNKTSRYNTQLPNLLIARWETGNPRPSILETG